MKKACMKCGGSMKPKMAKGGVAPKPFAAGIPYAAGAGQTDGKNGKMAKGGKVKAKMKMGGSLKPVPSDNTGLAKLPTAVRNKMGYQKKGGSVKRK